MSLHGQATGQSNIHVPYAFEFADATDRAAGTGYTIVPGDVGKLARQLDDNSLWMLTDDSPITWTAASGSGGSHASTHENGGGDEIDVTGLSGILADPQLSDTIIESSGPTALAVGAIANGEFLTRSGSNIVGASVSGGAVAGNGSTLGSVSAIGTIKYCTADKQTYISDGTLWRPLESPGWPRREGSDDIQFEGANADPPESMTWDNQASTTVDNNSARGSHLILSKTTTENKLSMLYKAVPASPNKTYALKVLPYFDGTGTNQAHAVGIGARSSGGKIIHLAVIQCVNGNGSALGPLVWKWTNSGSYSSNLTAPTSNYGFGMNVPVVLAITSDGTTLTFKYAAFAGGDEADYVTVGSEAIATFLGTFDYFGVVVYKNAGTAVKGVFDWIHIS